MLWTFLLALMVGILGFEFMNYTLPPDYVVESGTDLFSSDIFRQSLFLNVQREFRELPFIYLLILISWLGGFVLTIAEMVKQGELDFTMPEVKGLPSWRRSGAVAVTAVWALVAGLLRFVTPAASSATAAIGQNLALLGAVIALWAGVSLLVNRRHGRFIALTFAAGGVILSGPVLIAGGITFGLFMAGAGLLILFLLWDPAWRPLIIPPGIFAALSLGIGLLYTYLHAVSLREGLLFLIFYQGIEPVSSWYTLFFSPSSAVGSVVELRLLEAMQSLRFLSSFYIFLFGMWVFAAVSLSWRQLRQTRLRGSVAAYASLAAAFLIGIMLITQTNLRVVQADVIYKRAKPFDQQALQMDDRLSWDVAIKIYEEALELAPLEDFYFLFLGRALLERSALAETPEERNALLNNAQNRLFEAQSINPLNTDHTANLARLETRWVASNPEAEDRSSRLAEAEKYYQDAIALSPQNSVIRNEYANLALNLKGDCDQAIASFQESVEIDPFYIITYYSLAETLITCASAQSDEGQQQILYKAAIDSLEAAMARNANDARAWLQLGQLYYQTGQPEQALEAYGQAKTAANADLLVPWNVDFLEASAHSALGDVPLARALAEQALLTAPAEAAAQIESFLAGLPQN